MSKSYMIEPVAYARNGFSEKFGIPRQSREDSCLETRIEFTEAFQDPNMLRGIEGFSYLWLIWGFSEAKSWSPTVRPPRLGGNKRMGVFATRSPFRPNHLGLSSVRLVRVENANLTPQGGYVNVNVKGPMALVVTGADLLDGTPIYDIKPYLAYTDAKMDNVQLTMDKGTRDIHTASSRDCFAQEMVPLRVEGNFDGVPEATRRAIVEILEEDPRPGYQNDPERVYKMNYDGWEVSFRVAEKTIIVEKIAPK